MLSTWLRDLALARKLRVLGGCFLSAYIDRSDEASDHVNTSKRPLSLLSTYRY